MTRTQKIAKEAVIWINMIFAIPVLYLTAGLLPGDKINLNVLGSLVMIVVLVLVDAIITVPVWLWISRSRRPVLAPVRDWIKR